MNEMEPVDDSEFVYRRFPRTYFNAGLAIPIQREAFRPNSNDSTGLSVFRERFAQPLDALTTCIQPRSRIITLLGFPYGRYGIWV
jgi:hypothetical protein